jgi:signal transduction histidine kinase
LGFVAAVVSTAKEERRLLALRNRLLVGGLLLLALTCAGIYAATARWVERPVTRLAAAMDSLRAAPPPAGGAGDEIARLGSSFTSLLTTLGEKTESLLTAERELAHSQRLASIGLLAAGIAHDIGGPLSTILLQAGYWQERTDGRVQEAAEAVKRAATRISELRRELLTFDRRGALHLSDCELGPLLRGCLGLLASAGVRTRLDGPTDRLLVRADQALLLRAIGNIVDNAIRAMEGQGEIAVTLRHAESGWAEMTIEDTGPGIAPDDLPHVFEPFYGSRREGGGSGLGLAIAQEIIARHGGTIGVETTGQGARFRVLLPLLPPLPH